MTMNPLAVQLINQRPELPTGCEITAVTMMLAYSGAKVDKVVLAREMPFSETDPNEGFVGDPFTDNGDSIYPPALMNLVSKYAGSAVNLSGQTLAQLKEFIEKSQHPVVVWVGEFDGFHTHALVITGIGEAVFYNDCWIGERTTISVDVFEEKWKLKDRMALRLSVFGRII